MNKRLHISSILKQGATLAPKKVGLTKRDMDLIEYTIREQEKVLALKKIPDEIYNARITI